MKEIINENQLINLRYFFECYFNVSANYSELDMIVTEYKENESKEYIEGLKSEIELILKINDIELMNNFIKKYAMRNMKYNKIIELLHHIKNNI
ncbi:contact-dependent growth inhibition system immunity protein [Clostridium felsineum]|uniref:CdiI immunity protein domain-containing protein n=1 Tax=Clostridium felsineum TaxID=36839 RepID=A0A1S8LJJ7_9CLOT|nr:hypothetical protein [Clostridium felsineum]URZ05800.1 hypothetical protein CLROS_011310 [Clostridium felsineum]URZ10839.1 hypothetical protein CROST_015540 [Clostridium felsineum]